MNRVFVTLYLVIVCSLIFLGWGADRLWQIFGGDSDLEISEHSVFRLIETDAIWETEKSLPQIEASFSERLSRPVKILALSDFARSNFLTQLEAGKPVLVHNDEGVSSVYKRMMGGQVVMRLSQSEGQKKQVKNQKFYIFFLVGFYIAVAVVIYFWVWPLSRDLKILQAYTKKVGDDKLEKIELGSRSAVLELAEAFNIMAERINDLLASHKEMTYAVSHELRTPLARMKFAIEMAADTKNTDADAGHLSGLKKDVAEMDQLINELLTYAGFEQKNQKLEFEGGDLAALIKNLVDLNRNSDVGKSLDIEIIDELENQKVWCEWYLMERCFHNLIQNAFKYAESLMRVRLWRDEVHYYIAIEDDGPGIDDDQRQKIFQAFVRLRNAQENKSGFGLGLAIVHRIVKWHSGRVHVEASTFGGAKFVVRWPVRRNV
ncbi:MAG: two-component sensor histidine kinase [Agarilytica sp.]